MIFADSHCQCSMPLYLEVALSSCGDRHLPEPLVNNLEFPHNNRCGATTLMATFFCRPQCGHTRRFFLMFNTPAPFPALSPSPSLPFPSPSPPPLPYLCLPLTCTWKCIHLTNLKKGRRDAYTFISGCPNREEPPSKTHPYMEEAAFSNPSIQGRSPSEAHPYREKRKCFEYQHFLIVAPVQKILVDGVNLHLESKLQMDDNTNKIQLGVGFRLQGCLIVSCKGAWKLKF